MLITHWETVPSLLPSSLSLPNVEIPPSSPSPNLNPGAFAGRLKTTESWTFLSRFPVMVYDSSVAALPLCLISYIFHQFSLQVLTESRIIGRKGMTGQKRRTDTYKLLRLAIFTIDFEPRRIDTLPSSDLGMGIIVFERELGRSRNEKHSD